MGTRERQMSDQYTKLFRSITTSTVWMQPDPVRLVWITMLAQKDKDGVVLASLPGLAHIARVSLEDAEAAIEYLSAPDVYSRTKDHDGRRIEAVDGGWRILNHYKYRDTVDHEDRREYERTRKAAQRKQKHNANNGDSPGQSGTVRENSTHTDTDTDTDTEKSKSKSKTNPDGLVVADAVGSAPKTPPCPHREIIDAYHELLPVCPQVRQWTDMRKALLRQRWREDPERQTLAWWREFFSYVAGCGFLTGHSSPRGDVPPFLADLEWLVRPKNFVKVLEGRYDNRKAG